MGLFGGINRQKRNYDTYRRQAKQDYEYGGDLTEKGLAELDELDRRTMLDTEGLPDYMKEIFERGAGAITDDAQRSRRSFADDLLQTARRSGGRFDPNASLDYQIEREAAIDEDVFGARRDLATDEAGLTMEHTNAALDRLFAIRERKIGVGQAERDRAAQMWLGAMRGKQDWMLGLSSMAFGGMTAAAGGGAAGGPAGGYQYGRR